MGLWMMVWIGIDGFMRNGFGRNTVKCVAWRVLVIAFVEKHLGFSVG